MFSSPFSPSVSRGNRPPSLSSSPRKTAPKPHAQRGPSNTTPSRKIERELELLRVLMGAIGKTFSPPDLGSALAGAIQKALKGFETPPQGFPPGPSGDQGLSLVSAPLQFLTNLQKSHGDVVGFVMAGERVVLVADPLVAKEVLIDKAEVFVKEGTAFFPGSSLAGNGLLVSDGEVWRRQRQLSTPAFRRAAVESYSDSITRVTDGLLTDMWRGGGVRDIYSDFNEVTLRIVATALFGSDMDGPRARLIADSIATAFDFFGRRAATGFAVPEWLPTPDNVAYLSAVRELDDVVYGLINDRRADLVRLEAAAGGAVRPRDLLDRLILARDEEGTGMADKNLRDELMTLVVAGQETSAILLGWCCYHLARYPEVQERAARAAAGGLGGRRPTPEDVGTEALRPIEAIILETLRILPPAYMVGRCCNQTVMIGGEGGRWVLPKGTTVLVSPYLMQRDPRVWTSPSLFRPDRWTSVLEGGELDSPQSRAKPGATGNINGAAAKSGATSAAGPAPKPTFIQARVASADPSSQAASEAPAAQPGPTLRLQNGFTYTATIRSLVASGGNEAAAAAAAAATASAAAATSNGTRAPGSSSDSAPSSSGKGPSSASGPAGYPAGAGGGSGTGATSAAVLTMRGMGPNGAYIPFGAGPRNCIGTGFAMLEVTLVLAWLLPRYKLKLPRGPGVVPIEPRPLITLRPGPVELEIEERTQPLQ